MSDTTMADGYNNCGCNDNARTDALRALDASVAVVPYGQVAATVPARAARSDLLNNLTPEALNLTSAEIDALLTESGLSASYAAPETPFHLDHPATPPLTTSPPNFQRDMPEPHMPPATRPHRMPAPLAAILTPRPAQHLRLASHPDVAFMNEDPAVEGESVGPSESDKSDRQKRATCKCTNAELDKTFGNNGWRWQADKEGTPLTDEGNQDKGKGRLSYDVAGKNYPNDPGRFYFAARVKITVDKLSTAATIPITLTAYAWCGGVESYGAKVGDVVDDKPTGRPCTSFFDESGKAAWLQWFRTVYVLSEEAAVERFKELKKRKNRKPNASEVAYYEWTEYVPCKSGVYDIVIPIPPAPLGIDSSVRPSVFTYSHVKHMCTLEACGKTLVELKEHMERKLNVWDSGK